MWRGKTLREHKQNGYITFRDELNSRFLPVGKLAVSMTTNIPGEPMPRYDTIRMVEAAPANVEFHIIDLQKQMPMVIVDVKDQLSLNYNLGTATADVMTKAQTGYASLPNTLKLIQRNADFILQAYNASVAYDKFSQYNNSGMKDQNLQKNAWTTLSCGPYTNNKSAQLASAIEATAVKMNVIKTSIDGVVIIEPRIFEDARGYFFELFSQREFDEKVAPVRFVQDSESKSSYGVMRGLHFQRLPFNRVNWFAA